MTCACQAAVKHVLVLSCYGGRPAYGRVSGRGVGIMPAGWNHLSAVRAPGPWFLRSGDEDVLEAAGLVVAIAVSPLRGFGHGKRAIV